MKIKEIELNNFKQFYGKQKVKFAGYNDEKNVTVIYGENGRGKTSLYRALLFALYGDKFLDQDKGFHTTRQEEINPELYTINTNALSEDYKNQQKGVEAYVKVTLYNYKKEYILYRSLYGIQKSKSEIFEEDKSIKLTIKKSNDNTKVVKEKDKIDNIVNSILDKGVKNYFLFDGERIEKLTKATKGQREEVAKGIKNLLHIDELTCSIDALKKLKRKFRKETRKISTGDYKKLLKKLDELDDEKEKVEEKIKNKGGEKKRAQKELRSINNDLAKFKEYKDFINERNLLNEQKESLEDERNDLSNKIREFNNKAVVMLAKDILKKVYSDVNKKDKGGIDKKTKRILVENIINKNRRCICSTNIEKGDKYYQQLIKWRDKDEQTIDDKVKDFRDELIKILEYIKNNKENGNDLLNSFSKNEESIEEVNSKLERVNAKIGEEVSDEEFNDKEEYRKKLIKEISDIENEIDNLEKYLNKINKEIDNKQKEKKKKEKEQNIKNEYTKKLDLTERTLEELNKIKESFINEIKKDLEKEAINIFKKLIDPETKNTFDRIIVKEDYSLEIYDWNNRPFLANISAGQRQVMSLAFITALAKIAGGEKTLEMPLFMDTPFSRLSGKHRDNLLNEIPKLAPQWILLATDTELTSVEAKELRNTNKWGKIYILELIKDGYTKIKECKVKSFKPNR